MLATPGGPACIASLLPGKCRGPLRQQNELRTLQGTAVAFVMLLALQGVVKPTRLLGEGGAGQALREGQLQVPPFASVDPGRPPGVCAPPVHVLWAIGPNAAEVPQDQAREDLRADGLGVCVLIIEERGEDPQIPLFPALHREAATQPLCHKCPRNVMKRGGAAHQLTNVVPQLRLLFSVPVASLPFEKVVCFTSARCRRTTHGRRDLAPAARARALRQELPQSRLFVPVPAAVLLQQLVGARAHVADRAEVQAAELPKPAPA
mmetsp:Transcript_48570/g.155142  ORF Transcript_48570/g.155142 Transcript_48570/m.155142 type:complete len:263 (-) Transcript_48570:348-1136(-)